MSESRAHRFLRENSLSLFFLLLFLACLVGQAFAGWKQFNAQQVADELGTLSLSRVRPGIRDRLTRLELATDDLTYFGTNRVAIAALRTDAGPRA